MDKFGLFRVRNDGAGLYSVVAHSALSNDQCVVYQSRDKHHMESMCGILNAALHGRTPRDSDREDAREY